MNARTLTAAAVERIRAPASGQIDHFDHGYPGLALRVSYRGSKSWSKTLDKGESPKHQRPLQASSFAAVADEWLKRDQAHN